MFFSCIFVFLQFWVERDPAWPAISRPYPFLPVIKDVVEGDRGGLGLGRRGSRDGLCNLRKRGSVRQVTVVPPLPPPVPPLPPLGGLGGRREGEGF